MSFFRHARDMVRAARWLAVAGAVVCGWAGASSRAETVLTVPMALGADAAIKVAMPAAQPPRFGFAAVRVTVENTAGQDRTWQFQFQAGVRGQFPGPAAYDRSISVPAGQTRDIWVYVPVTENGTPGGAPNFAAPPPPTLGSSISTPTVAITKTPPGTKIMRTWSLSGGRIYRTEETTIDETTGEMVVVSNPVGMTSGASSTTRTSKPPAGSDVTYFIDPSSGDVRPSYSRATAGGPTKVTVTSRPAPGGPASTSVTKVKIETTPIGTKVIRTIGSPSAGTIPSSFITEEREIDSTTGAITTSMISSSGSRMSTRTTTPPRMGSEVTITINPNDGTISTSSRSLSNSTAPPKITIVTSTTPVSVNTASSVFPSRPKVYPSPYNGPAMTMTVDVTGPGIAGKSTVNFSALGSAANMRPIAATQTIERVLRESFNKEGVATPNLAAIDPTTLPADWRLWSGFAYVYLGTDEYVSLDAGRRAALRAWVAFGGQLILVPEDSGSKVTERVGGGTIVTLAKPIKEAILGAEWNERGLSVGGTLGQPDQPNLTVSPGSLLGTAVAEREPDTSWLAVFIVLFAAVVGPVNLFLFAPARRRHRLFFTTPLISIVAAVVLGFTIFVQDGSGGTGLRRALVILIPGDNQAAIIQEQTSRTGFLSSQTFPLADDTQLTTLPLEDTSLGRTGNFNTAPALLRNDGQGSGNWFGSRGRQAYLLQRLVPTRGRVERVGTAIDGSPIVQSSLAGTLRDFVFSDEKGKLWSAREVVPGKRTTLSDGGVWIGSFPLGGTPRFTELFGAVATTNIGVWGAKADLGDLAPLPTHDSVKWQKSDVIFTGRLEGLAANVTEAKR
jgi:hypothetical protein